MPATVTVAAPGMAAASSVASRGILWNSCVPWAISTGTPSFAISTDGVYRNHEMRYGCTLAQNSASYPGGLRISVFPAARRANALSDCASNAGGRPATN